MDERNKTLDSFNEPINPTATFQPSVDEKNLNDPFDRFVDSENILGKDGFYTTYLVPSTSAGTATNYSHIFTAKFGCEVLAVSEVHSVAGSAGTLDIRKSTGTQSPSGGNSVLNVTFDLTSAANTIVEKRGNSLSLSKGNRTLKTGDRLALYAASNPTGCQNVLVTIYLKYIGRGDYRS